MRRRFAWVKVYTDLLANETFLQLRVECGAQGALAWPLLLLLCGRGDDEAFEHGLVRLAPGKGYSPVTLARLLFFGYDDDQQESALDALKRTLGYLESVGWVETLDDGVLRITGWSERQSNPNTERYNRWMATRSTVDSTHSQPLTQRSFNTDSTNVQRTEDRGQRTEERREKTEDTDTPLPPASGGGVETMKSLPVANGGNGARPIENNDPRFEEIVSLFHATCPSYPRWERLTDARKRHLRARLVEESDIERWKVLLANMEASAWMKGSACGKLDWVVKNADNWLKTFEGQYLDKGF